MKKLKAYEAFGRLVVLRTKKVDEINFEGFVIQPNEYYPMGTHSKTWHRPTFKRFHGTITLNFL